MRVHVRVCVAQRPMTGGIYSKLTDTSLYTGAHKERFDESGHGRGIAGRVDHDKVLDLLCGVASGAVVVTRGAALVGSAS